MTACPSCGQIGDFDQYDRVFHCETQGCLVLTFTKGPRNIKEKSQ